MPKISLCRTVGTTSMSSTLSSWQRFHSSLSLTGLNVSSVDPGLHHEVGRETKTEEPMSVNQESQEQKHCSKVHSTPDIEKKYVHRVYDAIAPHFSSTRFAKWPKVAGFLDSLRPGSVILDAGCGNGKYLGLNPKCSYVGCDISAPLIDICAGRGHEVMVADAVNLPYRSGFGDAAISIAVLHHLSTENRRRKAIEELLRVVRRGGLVLITAWAVEQEDRSLLTKWTPLTCKYNEEWGVLNAPRVCNSSIITLESIPEIDENVCHYMSRSKRAYNQLKDHEENSTKEAGVEATLPSTIDGSLAIECSNRESQQEYFVPWHLPYHRAETESSASASALANGCARKDDRKGAVVYDRYYHVFIEGELGRLVSGIGNAVIIEQFYDKSNWCIVLEKT